MTEFLQARGDARHSQAHPALSPELRAAIARDLVPVRPLAAPWRRALAFAPLGVLLVAASPLLWGLGSSVQALPLWASWGLSAAQALVGLLVVGAALREAVPGRGLSRGMLGALAAATVAVFVGISLGSATALPTVVPVVDRLRFIWECFYMAAIVGVPALALVAWLAWRLLPGRPAIAGALCGLGAGLLTDAGVRLFCWVTEPMHVLLAHGGAIAALVVLGALLATGIDRLALARRRRDAR